MEEKSIDEKIKAIRELLTNKQRFFAEEYIVDLNAKQAAIRVGYSVKTAKEIGYENLTKPHVLEYVELLKKKRSGEIDVRAEDILKQLNIFRNSNIQDYVTIIKRIKFASTIDNPEELADDEILQLVRIGKAWYDNELIFKDFDDLTEEQLMCIESVKNTSNGIEIKLHGKDWTIDKINRHIGFYEKDNKMKFIEQKPPKIEFYNSKENE